jgi:hypothetical protein
MVHCRTTNSWPVSRAGGYERLAQGNTRPSLSHPLLRRSALSLRSCASQCALLVALPHYSSPLLPTCSPCSSVLPRHASRWFLPSAARMFGCQSMYVCATNVDAPTKADPRSRFVAVSLLSALSLLYFARAGLLVALPGKAILRGTGNAILPMFDWIGTPENPKASHSFQAPSYFLERSCKPAGWLHTAPAMRWRLRLPIICCLACCKAAPAD